MRSFRAASRRAQESTRRLARSRCSVRLSAFVAGSLALGVVLGLAVATARSARAPTRAFASPPCDGFDYPVGPPHAIGYYDAQPFGEAEHLGSDWNGNGGGDTDYGDPVHSIAGGRVVFAADVGGGWGNVVRIVHRCEDGTVESLYAHLASIAVDPGAVVRRGDPIGTMGDAGGQYLAHLHLEIRRVVGLPIGGGYGADAGDHVDPTAFIDARRP
jgi:murein DD-endopeptidase MepM/ murein hydrolase activator NlpD